MYDVQDDIMFIGPDGQSVLMRNGRFPGERVGGGFGIRAVFLVPDLFLVPRPLLLGEVPQSRNPKPETRYPNPKTRDQKKPSWFLASPPAAPYKSELLIWGTDQARCISFAKVSWASSQNRCRANLAHMQFEARTMSVIKPVRSQKSYATSPFQA